MNTTEKTLVNILDVQGVIDIAAASTPLIHMNGSSARSLAKEWDNFHAALKNAAELFPHESFHGRNHYVKPDWPNGADQARDAGCHMNALISRMIDIAMSVRISINQQTPNQ